MLLKRLLFILSKFGAIFVADLFTTCRDSNTLVSGGCDGLFVWDVTSGQSVRHIGVGENPSQHESDIECLAWAYQGSTLLTGSKDTNIKVWDVNRGYSLLETIFGHKSTVMALKTSDSSGKLASAGRDSTIKVWDISSLSVSHFQCSILSTHHQQAFVATAALRRFWN